MFEPPVFYHRGIYKTLKRHRASLYVHRVKIWIWVTLRVRASGKSLLKVAFAIRPRIWPIRGLNMKARSIRAINRTYRRPTRLSVVARVKAEIASKEELVDGVRWVQIFVHLIGQSCLSPLQAVEEATSLVEEIAGQSMLG
jgi:hypothetical protein